LLLPQRQQRFSLALPTQLQQHRRLLMI